MASKPQTSEAFAQTPDALAEQMQVTFDMEELADFFSGFEPLSDPFGLLCGANSDQEGPI